MKNRFNDTYIWQDGRYSWMAWNKAVGIGATGLDRAEAERTFKAEWGDRGEINWIENPPEPPRRPGEPATPIADAIEASDEHRRGHSVYRRLLAEFHPDKNPDAIYSAGDVTRVIVEVWQACR